MQLMETRDGGGTATITLTDWIREPAATTASPPVAMPSRDSDADLTAAIQASLQSEPPGLYWDAEVIDEQDR